MIAFAHISENQTIRIAGRQGTEESEIVVSFTQQTRARADARRQMFVFLFAIGIDEVALAQLEFVATIASAPTSQNIDLARLHSANRMVHCQMNQSHFMFIAVVDHHFAAAHDGSGEYSISSPEFLARRAAAEGATAAENRRRADADDGDNKNEEDKSRNHDQIQRIGMHL